MKINAFPVISDCEHFYQSKLFIFSLKPMTDGTKSQMCREKICDTACAKSRDSDQAAHLRSLIIGFAVRCIDSLGAIDCQSRQERI